ncbi:MAG TPA: hypothetical protein VF782_15430 [Allosphingosinicella sp.]|jgi:hypothetical protein
MAFVLNHFQTQHGFSTVGLHENDGDDNRVVYVVVPAKAKGRVSPVQARTKAKAAAKKALLDAAAAL